MQLIPSVAGHSECQLKAQREWTGVTGGGITLRMDIYENEGGASA